VLILYSSYSGAPFGGFRACAGTAVQMAAAIFWVPLKLTDTARAGLS